MFKITEDTYLEEGKYLCPSCNTENWYYFGENTPRAVCYFCRRPEIPNALRLRRNQLDRYNFHFRRKGQDDGERKKKVYTSCYSPY